MVEAATADRLEELKPQIVEEMRKVDVDKVETEFGNFSVGQMARWKYSKAVEDLQEKEKATGVASQTVSTVLRFTKPKEQ